MHKRTGEIWEMISADFRYDQFFFEGQQRLIAPAAGDIVDFEPYLQKDKMYTKDISDVEFIGFL